MLLWWVLPWLPWDVLLDFAFVPAPTFGEEFWAEDVCGGIFLGFFYDVVKQIFDQPNYDLVRQDPFSSTVSRKSEGLQVSKRTHVGMVCVN